MTKELVDTPLISVITPYRNAYEFIPGLISTVQAQTYANWECLLVDHGSTDGSAAYAQALVVDDHRFRCISVDTNLTPQKKSPAIPRNVGLDSMRGSLVCFLDVDDRWHPEKLQRQLAFHLTHHLDLSVTAYWRVNSYNQESCLWRCPPRHMSFRSLLNNNTIPMLSAMVNSSLLMQGFHHESLRFQPVSHEDYVFWLMLLQNNRAIRYGCLAEGLAFHYRHPNNLTARRLEMGAWLFRAYNALMGRNHAFARTIIAIFHKICASLVDVFGNRRVGTSVDLLLASKPLCLRASRTNDLPK